MSGEFFARVIATQAKALAAAGGIATAPISAIFDGDSKSGEPSAALQWVNARTPLDVYLSTNLGVGGSKTDSGTNNLTNATRMANMVAAIAADIAKGYKPDIWLTIGTNDFSANASPETVIANIRKYHNTARAAGARYLILMSVDPRSGGSNRLLAINSAYFDYAVAIPDAFYCDTTPILLDPDPANVTHAPIGGSSGAALTPMSDGLHCNAYGCYLKRLAVGPMASVLYPRKRLPLLSKADIYDATAAPRGNLFGLVGSAGGAGSTTGTGRMTAMGGDITGITNSGTGSITGTCPLGWVLGGTLTGDLGLTFSVETCTALDALTGLSGSKCVRVSFSGTPSSNGEMTLTRYPPSSDLGPIDMLMELLFNTNALAGCFGITCSTVNVSPTTNISLGSVSPTLLGDQLPQLDGLLFIDKRVTAPATGYSGATIRIKWRAGVAISGSVDLIGISWRPAGPLPAASA